MIKKEQSNYYEIMLFIYKNLYLFFKKILWLTSKIKEHSKSKRVFSKTQRNYWQRKHQRVLDTGKKLDLDSKYQRMQLKAIILIKSVHSQEMLVSEALF